MSAGEGAKKEGHKEKACERLHCGVGMSLSLWGPDDYAAHRFRELTEGASGIYCVSDKVFCNAICFADTLCRWHGCS